MTNHPQANINQTTENSIANETLWVSKITHFNAEIPLWVTNSQTEICHYISSYKLFNSSASIIVRNNYNLEKKSLNISVLINWVADHEINGIELFLN